MRRALLTMAWLAAAAGTASPSNDVGRGASILTGTDGLGLIAFQSLSGNAVWTAHCANANCSGAFVAAVDGESPSVTVGGDGLGLIAYHDEVNTDLKVAHCSNLDCFPKTVTTLG